MKTIQSKSSRLARHVLATMLAVGMGGFYAGRLQAQGPPATTNSGQPAASSAQPQDQSSSETPPARRGGRGAAGNGPPAGGFRGGLGSTSFGESAFEAPTPTNVAPAHLEAVVYEVQIPESRLVEINAAALAAKAANPASFSEALGLLGAAKLLYKVDQDVNLYGQAITVGASEPMIMGANVGPRGNRANLLTYPITGLIARIAAVASNNAQQKDALEVRLDFQLSLIGQSNVEITDGQNASSVRTLELSQTRQPKFGKPSVLFTVSSMGSGDKSPPVAYVIRYVLTQN